MLTNGVYAELYEYCGEPPKLQLKNSMAKVTRRTLEVFCTQKIPVTDTKDLVRLFGI